MLCDTQKLTKIPVYGYLQILSNAFQQHDAGRTPTHQWQIPVRNTTNFVSYKCFTHECLKIKYSKFSTTLLCVKPRMSLKHSWQNLQTSITPKKRKALLPVTRRSLFLGANPKLFFNLKKKKSFFLVFSCFYIVSDCVTHSLCRHILIKFSKNW